MNGSLDQRLRYNTWANDTLYRAMKANNAPPAALRAFQHILETEMTWTGRMLGIENANVALWGDASWGQCDDWLATVGDRIPAAAGDTSPGALAATFRYRNSSGREFESQVGEVLEHMLLHSAQYRGEAAGFANAAGTQMPDLDFIFWIRAGEPAAGAS